MLTNLGVGRAQLQLGSSHSWSFTGQRLEGSSQKLAHSHVCLWTERIQAPGTGCDGLLLPVSATRPQGSHGSYRVTRAPRATVPRATCKSGPAFPNLACHSHLGLPRLKGRGTVSTSWKGCQRIRGHLCGFKTTARDFPGGAVVKNPPANAGDTGLTPGPGRSHVPRSN